MHSEGAFPTVRLRRLRYLPAMRRLVRQVHLRAEQMILPVFVRPGRGVKKEIPSMPGHWQLSPDLAAQEVREAARLGLGGVLLFGIPEQKDPEGREALRPDGVIPQAIRAAKDAAPEVLVITDLCFCEYTSHGHCGPICQRAGRTDVDNDTTLQLLGQQAVVHAQAGADLVAPSGMMDGMVGAIRKALDAAGFEHVPILSYAAKYASAFYGPFREAAESAPQFGDRRSYQMDPASRTEAALREIQLDLAEGADMVMVKPALAYLDVIREVRCRWPEIPLAAYNVSGEYSMVKAASERGWLDEKQIALEILTAIGRAGADIIITYWAKQAAGWLAEAKP
ncbi:MAG: porphobilinogen synthase [Thermoguttaceae bacterium]|nr:porphobilinogen synthase [Thermoguttaceae bacterium]MDW8039715.1 porphobilinogen synthase [Thermoguttaceae bacterium]